MNRSSSENSQDPKYLASLHECFNVCRACLAPNDLECLFENDGRKAQMLEELTGIDVGLRLKMESIKT